MGFTFNGVLQRATNSELSFRVRWSYAKRCIWKHARWTDMPFYVPLERIGYASGISPDSIHTFPLHSSITEAQLACMITITTEERRRYRAKFDHYRRRRAAEKSSGRLRTAEHYRAFLARPDYYDYRCIPLAPYTIDGHTYGYLNATGEMCIRPQFTQAGPFLKNMAQVKIGARPYLISLTGEIIRALGAPSHDTPPPAASL